MHLKDVVIAFQNKAFYNSGRRPQERGFVVIAFQNKAFYNKALDEAYEKAVVIAFQNKAFYNKWIGTEFGALSCNSLSK